MGDAPSKTVHITGAQHLHWQERMQTLPALWKCASRPEPLTSILLASYTTRLTLPWGCGVHSVELTQNKMRNHADGGHGDWGGRWGEIPRIWGWVNACKL